MTIYKRVWVVTDGNGDTVEFDSEQDADDYIVETKELIDGILERWDAFVAGLKVGMEQDDAGRWYVPAPASATGGDEEE